MPSQEVQNAIDNAREAARKLSSARMEFAKRFVFNKTPVLGKDMPTPVSDKLAEQKTIIDTGDELHIREFEMRLAMLALEHAIK